MMDMLMGWINAAKTWQAAAGGWRDKACALQAELDAKYSAREDELLRALARVSAENQRLQEAVCRMGVRLSTADGLSDEAS